MIVSTRLVQMCEIIFHGGVGDAGICSSESTGAIEGRGLHHLDPTASALARAPHQHLREASAVPARLSPGIAVSRWACGPMAMARDAVAAAWVEDFFALTIRSSTACRATSRQVTLALQKHQRMSRSSAEKSISDDKARAETGGETRITAEFDLRLRMKIWVDAYDLLEHEAWLPMV